MNRFLAVLTVGCAFGLTACSDDEPVADNPVVATSGAPTTTTGAPTTTAAAATPANSAGQRAAATSLVAAWKANDRIGAARVAKTPAVDAMFRVKFESEAGAPVLQDCAKNPGFENKDACSFTYPGGSMHFLMSSSGNQWMVDRIEYVAD